LSRHIDGLATTHGHALRYLHISPHLLPTFLSTTLQAVANHVIDYRTPLLSCTSWNVLYACFSTEHSCLRTAIPTSMVRQIARGLQPCKITPMTHCVALGCVCIAGRIGKVATLNFVHTRILTDFCSRYYRALVRKNDQKEETACLCSATE
jgi:hypothetical protein